MLRSPSYVSQQCRKPFIPSPINEYSSHNSSQGSFGFPSETNIELLKDKYKSAVKPLTPVLTKGFTGSGLKLVHNEPTCSYWSAAMAKPLVPVEQPANLNDISVSSSGIYEKIQSIQSYSVQSVEDEERVLLKSIQHDVFYAIQKYQTKLQKCKFTKPRASHPNQIRQQIEKLSLPDTNKTKTDSKTFIIGGGRKTRQLSSTSMGSLEQKKSVERGVSNKVSRSQSQSNKYTQNTKKTTQRMPNMSPYLKPQAKPQAKIPKAKPTKQLKCRNPANKENLKDQSLSAQQTFFSIQEVHEDSSSKKKQRQQERLSQRPLTINLYGNNHKSSLTDKTHKQANSKLRK